MQKSFAVALDAARKKLSMMVGRAKCGDSTVPRSSAVHSAICEHLTIRARPATNSGAT